MSVRVGIVGLGGVADRIHLPVCRGVPEIEVAAGCDPNSQAREKMAQKYGIPQTFETVEGMLAAITPEVIIVGTPPNSHFAICRLAFEAGAHVFCEKPFMPSLEEADRVIRLAEEKQRLLRVNNQYRFMSFYRETKRRLEKGEFGRLYYIQCWQHMFHPPEKETNWRNQLKQYALYEFGTHALDLVCFFFDSLPASLHADIPRCRPEYDADVLVHASLAFPDERLATFSFHRVSHATEKYLEMRLDCENASLRLSLGGVARFSVEWSRNAGHPVVKAGLLKGGQARAEVEGHSRAYCSSRKGEFASATAEHLKFFLEEMRQSPPPLAGAREAREILRLVFAGYESARTGETVRFERAGAG